MEKNKIKKFRKNWTTYEENFLKVIYYSNNGFPDIEELTSISMLLNTELKRVKFWFQNKRQRKKMEITDEIIENYEKFLK